MSWGRGPSHRETSGTSRTEQPGAIATAQESLISETAPSNGRTARRRLRDAKGTLVLIGGGTSAHGPAIGGFIEIRGGKGGGAVGGLNTPGGPVGGGGGKGVSGLRQGGAAEPGGSVRRTGRWGFGS